MSVVRPSVTWAKIESEFCTGLFWLYNTRVHKSRIRFASKIATRFAGYWSVMLIPGHWNQSWIEYIPMLKINQFSKKEIFDINIIMGK